MSEQFPICTVRLPSFGRGCVIRVRSWRVSKSGTCKKRAAGGSSPRAILRQQPISTTALDRGRQFSVSELGVELSLNTFLLGCRSRVGHQHLNLRKVRMSDTSQIALIRKLYDAMGNVNTFKSLLAD